MRKSAIFTMVKNEKVFLPIWESYYKKHFSSDDIFILDHNSTEEICLEIAKKYNYIPIKNPYYDDLWRTEVIKAFQKFLLEIYDFVLFTDADEILESATWGGYGWGVADEYIS